MNRNQSNVSARYEGFHKWMKPKMDGLLYGKANEHG